MLLIFLAIVCDWSELAVTTELGTFVLVLAFGVGERIRRELMSLLRYCIFLFYGGGYYILM